MTTLDNKNINYLNKTFSEFKNNLKDYAKTYFPTTYNDFSDASTGMMFIEMASYVGDVLSFYLDTQFQENLLLYTKERENIMAMAYTLGYRPKISYASTTSVDIYQLLPIITTGGVQNPDWSYGIVIPENTTLKSSSTTNKFLTRSKIDFTDGTADVSIYNSSYFLAKKSVEVVSGEVKTTTFTFTSPQKFTSVSLSDANVLQILSVVDSSNNNWYEVPYLAQETILDRTTNTNFTNDSVPYLLSYKKVPYRFVTRFQADGTLKIQFGAGTSSTKSDSQILPTPDNVQLGLVPTVSNLENNYNKAAVFFAKEYGIVPSNTTLTVTYIVGGGISSNVPSNDITQLNSAIDTTYFTNGITILDPYYSSIVSNLIITNPNPAVGGRDGDTIEEIRLNTLQSFSSQDRAVTKEDYAVRSLSMPPQYGTVAKAFVTQELTNNPDLDPLIDKNPLALSLYVLGYDSNKNLQVIPSVLQNNLKTYIQTYRIATDAINIKNAFIVNIGLNFDITVVPGFNNREILNNCLLGLKEYFSIDRWQINQSIKISEIYAVLLKIKGVQSVLKVEIVNKQGGSYSPYGYDIQGATKSNTIYPSMDPSIFEVKYPDQDIKGRIVVI
jgi:hypothetical protein